MTIQTPLARAMRDAELNDAELARRIGCTSQHINRCRRGMKTLSPTLAQAAIRELGDRVSLSDLLFAAESAAA